MDDVDGYFKNSNVGKIFSVDGLNMLLDIIWERTAIFWIGFLSTAGWLFTVKYGLMKDKLDKNLP